MVSWLTLTWLLTLGKCFSRLELFFRAERLLTYDRTVRVILTRYQSAVIPPKLGSLLSSLPNLHTLQVFHAHSEMTSAIRNGFEEVVLPTIRTLIIPGHCHEILKCCPQVI